MKILVIAAHPDDELLGCGATIAKYTLGGNEVNSLILGEGVTSRDDSESEDVDRLKMECRKVGERLGIKNIRFEDLPDNMFDTVPLLDVVKVVEAEINDKQPDMIFTHSTADLNIDHRITFQAVLTAVRPMGKHTFRSIYSFEIPSSTEWSMHRITPRFKPNTFTDATNTINIKTECLKIYSDEIRPSPHPRSITRIISRAMYWGSVVGVDFAEPFELIRCFI